MTAAGQFLVGALLVVVAFVVVGLVEIICTFDLGAVILCTIFAALATVALVAACKIDAAP